MDFWQAVTICSLLIGLIASIAAIVGFFVDVQKLKHKYKVLVISVPLAIALLAGGLVSSLYHPVASNASKSSGAQAKGTTPTATISQTSNSNSNSTLTSTPTLTPSPTLSSASTPSPTPSPSPSSSTPLYQADWSYGLNGWTGPASWKVSGGLLLSDGSSASGIYVSTLITCPYTVSVSDYEIDAQVQIIRRDVTSGNGETTGFFVRGDGQNNGYFVGENNSSQLFVALSSSGGNQVSQLKTVSYASNLSYHTYQLKAQGNTITLSIDGTKYLTVADNTYISGGQIGIYASNDQIQVKSFQVKALAGK